MLQQIFIHKVYSVQESRGDEVSFYNTIHLAAHLNILEHLFSLQVSAAAKQRARSVFSGLHDLRAALAK